MIDWIARARHAVTKTAPPPTDEPDETPVSAVLSVPMGGLCAQAPQPTSDADAEAFEERAGILEFDAGMSRADAEFVAIVASATDRAKTQGRGRLKNGEGLPLSTVADRAATFGASTQAEPAPFHAWRAEALRRGYAPSLAGALASVLEARTADSDDRRLCIECAGLLDSGRCTTAQQGRIHGSDRRLEPVRTILHRCEGFELRKGMPC